MPEEMTGEMQVLLAFVGVDPEDREAVRLVEALEAAAVEEICRVTGIDWTTRENNRTFREAVRTQVWLSYYALRDDGKNAAFLQQYLTGLLCSLQLCRGEESHHADV